MKKTKKTRLDQSLQRLEKKTRYPLRYAPTSLTKKDRNKQIAMIRQSRRQYRRNIFKTRKRVPSFQSRPSSHVATAKRMYDVPSMAITPSLVQKTGCSREAMEAIFQKGLGAYYSSGSRPNQTAQSWAAARLASALTAGKAAAVDYSILASGCKHKESKALRLARQARRKYGHGQGRTRVFIPS